MEKIKLNLGGGPKRIEGYKNVDALEWDGVTDIVQDFTKLPWKIEDNSVDEILMEECLEHISFKFTNSVLYECLRILKPGGKVHIQVPDCGKAMEYYVNKQICECVPHKAKDWESYKSDPRCFVCGGKGMIHPNRWLYSFTGAQKHEFDTHKAIFSKDIMEAHLKSVGFREITFKDNIYKVVVKAIK